jgi:hypothetical protein
MPCTDLARVVQSLSDMKTLTAEDLRALRIASSDAGLVDEPSLVRQSRKLKSLGLIGQGGFITDAGRDELGLAMQAHGLMPDGSE